MRTWNLHHTYVAIVGFIKGSTHLFSRQFFIYNKIFIEIHSNRKVWTLDFSSKSQSFTQSMERNQVMLSITPDNVWWMWDVGGTSKRETSWARAALIIIVSSNITEVLEVWKCDDEWDGNEMEVWRGRVIQNDFNSRVSNIEKFAW